MEQIFDGIQRPLEVIANMTNSVFVPKGIDIPSLNQDKLWLWVPNPKLKVGAMVTGGDIVGTCYENTLFDEHRIMIPPLDKGKITYIAPEGNYNINEEMV